MPRRTHGARPGDDDSRRRRPLGAVRRTQMITTYGVGAMIAVGDQSYIVSGLDSWDSQEDERVWEPRLESALKVEEFRLPPFSPAPRGNGAKVRRFPEMYVCPGCRALRRHRDFGTRHDGNSCGDCGTPITPSRFVVACARGHLDEFPYHRWLHARPRGEGEFTPSGCDRTKARLTLTAEGRTASLQSIVVACDCGRTGSLEGAFGRSAMAGLGIACDGGRPWLGRDARETCGEELRVLQRGSSAAWFPTVESALSIPPWHDTLVDLVRGERRQLLGADISYVETFARRAGWLDDGEYTLKEVLDTIRLLEDSRRDTPEEPESATQFEAARRLRREEHRQLVRETPESPRNKHFVCVPPSDASDTDVPGVGRVMLVKRLREVRALSSFTRIEPLVRSEADYRRAMPLAREERFPWLPAIEVVGEGVFLELDAERLSSWEGLVGSHSPQARTDRMRSAHERLLRSRAAVEEDQPSALTSRLVLVHTLAHALINEWSLDCGYPASALRERLYVDGEMAGVLLYTATSDSAGSLGGIVFQGEPARLAASLASAGERLSWCSADPLCMEADASGVNGLNLAACHNCVLLPETSCELNNLFLDRAMLVGTPDGLTPGYLS
ncbi:DrmB family protein [Streptomyces sp. MS19]|uniref:DrmB family protein n=1 Tax=Streptomyces sp. MS19 TaxID=3385972 RepID=UPI0039A18459